MLNSFSLVKDKFAIIRVGLGLSSSNDLNGVSNLELFITTTILLLNDFCRSRSNTDSNRMKVGHL